MSHPAFAGGSIRREEDGVTRLQSEHGEFPPGPIRLELLEAKTAKLTLQAAQQCWTVVTR
jgi:hypothetical protein